MTGGSSSVLRDEAALRDAMTSSIEHHHPDVALKLFKMAVNRGSIRGRDPRLVPQSALTYYLASRASVHVGLVDQASELMNQAHTCADYRDNEQLQFKHMCELAEHFAIERNFARARSCLMTASDILPENTEAWFSRQLIEQHIRMIEGRSSSFTDLANMRDELILLTKGGSITNRQLLLDASWLLLLASIRFRRKQAFSEVMQDLRTGRQCAFYDHSLFIHVTEADKQRQYDARFLLRFGLIRRFVARHLIMRPVL